MSTVNCPQLTREEVAIQIASLAQRIVDGHYGDIFGIGIVISATEDFAVHHVGNTVTCGAVIGLLETGKYHVLSEGLSE